MSFLYRIFSKNTKNEITVKGISQSQLSHPVRSERTFSAAPLGSLTIEASLVFPLFLFFSVCIMHFLILLLLQSDIQVHLEEAARRITKREYAAQCEDALTTLNTNILTIRADVLDDELSGRINRSLIPGGTSSFHTELSSYDPETGILDIVATYTYRFPYIPEKIGTVRFLQRCRCRAWIGHELKDSNPGSTVSGETDGSTVYITPNGTVYHTSPQCPYLDLSIKSVAVKDIPSLRNADGSIYGKCSCFVKGSAYAYVTSYGILYHSDTNCPSLKRTVLEIDISKAGSRKPCSKCGGAH